MLFRSSGVLLDHMLMSLSPFTYSSSGSRRAGQEVIEEQEMIACNWEVVACLLHKQCRPDNLDCQDHLACLSGPGEDDKVTR